MTGWAELTRRSLDELRATDETYRPTNFWGPGVDRLLSEMETIGLEKFKSWPSAPIWFYPMYGDGWTEATLAKALQSAKQVNPRANQGYFYNSLNGWFEARRDFDVAMMAWDQHRWPFDIGGHGESKVGSPWQAFGGVPGGSAQFGRAYANYLLLLAALSRHVDRPPTSFLEIGGGFGVLGEIVRTRDPQARYVDLDIPPLLTVASYYLTELFGADSVTVYDPQTAARGPISVPECGVLPNFRIEDLDAQFDVFVNSFSFQEMEPPVVDHYIGQVCDKGITYAVSLNSREGKPKAAQAGDWGALDPVKSADIIDMFDRRGLELVGQYDTPLVRSAGQVNVFRRR